MFGKFLPNIALGIVAYIYEALLSVRAKKMRG